MRVDLTDIRPTIVPKSDQINSEQLLAGPLTITVTELRVGASDEQPVAIHYENDQGRPYKPCKTMRKVLVLAWGANSLEWVGKSMTLYCDPGVKFGGAEVGGIRISHMTDIPDKGINVQLTATKGKKAPHNIKPLAAKPAARRADPAATVAALLEKGDTAGAALELFSMPEAASKALMDGMDDATYNAVTAAWPKAA